MVYIPASEIAERIENPKGANVVILGALLGKKPMVRQETMAEAIRHILGERKARFLPGNLRALAAGMEFVS